MLGEALMHRVYEPVDLLEAELLISVLASEGITAHLVGEHLLGATGELPVAGLLGLLVENACAQRASGLIAEYNAALPVTADDSDDSPGVLVC